MPSHLPKPQSTSIVLCNRKSFDLRHHRSTQHHTPHRTIQPISSSVYQYLPPPHICYTTDIDSQYPCKFSRRSHQKCLLSQASKCSSLRSQAYLEIVGIWYLSENRRPLLKRETCASLAQLTFVLPSRPCNSSLEPSLSCNHPVFTNCHTLCPCGLHRPRKTVAVW